jgi:hypothetical protein
VILVAKNRCDDIAERISAQECGKMNFVLFDFLKGGEFGQLRVR